MARKLSQKANRYLHATNPRVLSSKDLGIDRTTKQTTYLEGGFNGLPYIKVGIKREKILPQKKRVFQVEDKDGKIRRYISTV